MPVWLDIFYLLTMKRRILILVIIILAVVIGYGLGLKTNPGQERLQSDMKFRVSFGLRLYRALETGDTNRALEDVRFVLWSDTVGYERAFGVPTGSGGFASRFVEAKAITAEVLPTLVTNAETFARDVKSLFATNNIKIENITIKRSDDGS